MKDNPPISFTTILWDNYSQSSRLLGPYTSLDDALFDLTSEGIDTSMDKSAEIQSHKRYAVVEIEHQFADINGNPYVTYQYYQSV
jgi:hypothetical protein